MSLLKRKIQTPSSPPPPRRDNVVRVKEEEKKEREEKLRRKRRVEERGGREGLEQRKGEAWANKARGPCSYLSRRGSAETRKTDSTARQWPSFMNARAKVYASPPPRIFLSRCARRCDGLGCFPFPPISLLFVTDVPNFRTLHVERERKKGVTLCTRMKALVIKSISHSLSDFWSFGLLSSHFARNRGNSCSSCCLVANDSFEPFVDLAERDIVL